jgi:hypothetical protein
MGEGEMIGIHVPEGVNLVVTPNDFETYAQAIEAFWIDAPAGDEG